MTKRELGAIFSEDLLFDRGGCGARGGAVSYASDVNSFTKGATTTTSSPYYCYYYPPQQKHTNRKKQKNGGGGGPSDHYFFSTSDKINLNEDDDEEVGCFVFSEKDNVKDGEEEENFIQFIKNLESNTHSNNKNNSNNKNSSNNNIKNNPSTNHNINNIQSSDHSPFGDLQFSDDISVFDEVPLFSDGLGLFFPDSPFGAAAVVNDVVANQILQGDKDYDDALFVFSSFYSEDIIHNIVRGLSSFVLSKITSTDHLSVSNNVTLPKDSFSESRAAHRALFCDDPITSSVPQQHEILHFIERIVTARSLTSEVLVGAAIYINILQHTHNLCITSSNWRSILLVTLLTATKFIGDYCVWNIDWMSVMSPMKMDLRHLNKLECVFLVEMDYNLNISLVDYLEMLQNLRRGENGEDGGPSDR